MKKPGKTKKYMNMLQPNPGLGKEDEGNHYFYFPCRGCFTSYRKNIWQGFTNSIWDPTDREMDNSYLIFEEEPDNTYDPNAIAVVCRGEIFGTAGYVGKEYCSKIKEILKDCKSYRIDMVDEKEVGQGEIKLVMTWK